MSRRSKPEPFRSWADVPLTIFMDDAVRITRKSATTIYREIDRKQFHPAPLPRVGRTSAICWSKDAFIAEYGGDYMQRQRRETSKRGRCFSGPRRMPIAS